LTPVGYAFRVPRRLDVLGFPVQAAESAISWKNMRVRYGRIINLLSLRALRSSGNSPHATPEDSCGPGISESRVTCETSIAFPQSSRRNDTSVQLTVTRRNRVHRNSLRRKHQFQQPLARLPRKAFGTRDACTPSAWRFGGRHDRCTLSPNTRAPLETPTRKEYRMDCGRGLDLAHAFPEVSERNATVFGITEGKGTVNYRSGLLQ
jgi:hypothetical protein